MIAHSTLWIDHKGRLCETPPMTGSLLAVAGNGIGPDMIAKHDLGIVDGKVGQHGKPALQPKSTPDPLFADRTLWCTSEGILVDDKPEKGGVKLAVAGEKIPRGYVIMHRLASRDGVIRQKSAPKADNKMVGGVPNK